MTRGRCADLAHKISRRLKKLLGLYGWKIEIAICRTSSNEAVAEVSVQAEYCRADIAIDNARIENEDFLLETLVHEFCHILHFPIEAAAPVIYIAVADEARKVVEEVFTQACERFITSLEPLVLEAYRREYQ